MEPVLSDPLLQFRPGTVRAVRALYGLDGPGRMEEAVRILDDWVKKQSHFKEKEFSRKYLEATIIQTKGSVERAKSKIDKYCTMRTLLPKFFSMTNVKEELDANFFKIFRSLVLPKMTETYSRVLMAGLKHVPDMLTSSLLSEMFVYNNLILEYVKANDYFNGFVLIADLSEANLMDLIGKLNVFEMSQWFTLFMDGYGIRILAIHVLSSSKFVDAFITVLKKGLPAKIGERVHVHSTTETLSEAIPKDILPEEYGGNERSIRVLTEEWLNLLSSESHVQYLKEMSEYGIDERYTRSDRIMDEQLGTPGTFRTLNIVD